jgi:hypothetical protein
MLLSSARPSWDWMAYQYIRILLSRRELMKRLKLTDCVISPAIDIVVDCNDIYHMFGIPK